MSNLASQSATGLGQHKRAGTEKGKTYKADLKPAQFVDLDDIFTSGKHISISACLPTITVERRQNGKLLIAARFCLETTILDYHSSVRNNHQLFFHNIRLRYHHNEKNERIVATDPESSPMTSFIVTKETSSQTAAEGSLSAAQTPSASVSLTLTRSAQLNVQYEATSWSTNAHRTANGYQWCWTGTYHDTKQLTTDMTQAVKRHVMIKRIAQIDNLKRRIYDKGPGQPATAPPPRPVPNTSSQSTMVEESYDDWLKRLHQILMRHFTFKFHVEVRVKRRIGRLHRRFIMSFNRAKANDCYATEAMKIIMNPTREWIKGIIQDGGGTKGMFRYPLESTIDIEHELEQLKSRTMKQGDHWDKLRNQIFERDSGDPLLATYGPTRLSSSVDRHLADSLKATQLGRETSHPSMVERGNADEPETDVKKPEPKGLVPLNEYWPPKSETKEKS